MVALATPETEWLQACELNYFEEWPPHTKDLNSNDNLRPLVKNVVNGTDTRIFPRVKAAADKVWKEFRFCSKSRFAQYPVKSVPQF